MADFTIRLGVEDDLSALPEIERAAGLLFLEAQMPEIAHDTLPTVAELREHLGRLWVARLPEGTVAGYLQADMIDGAVHIEQITVHPQHGRRGIGRALIKTLSNWASAHGLTAVTLTTFRDVAWNAPYYRSLGFEVIEDLTPGLQELWNHEATLGLTRWPRVVMRKLLP